MLVAEHDDGETYINANSISRSAASTRAEFKRVYSPPIADEFSGSLISSLRSKEEHDLANKKCRVHARCHQYADGSQRNLGGDGYWTFVEGESEARSRFVQIFESGPVVNPDLPSEIGAATITEDREKELRKRCVPEQASAQAAYDRPRMLVTERINFARKPLGFVAKKVTIRESRKRVEYSAPERRDYTVWRFISEFVVKSPFMSLMFIGAVWLAVKSYGLSGAAKFFGSIFLLIILSGTVPFCLKWIHRRFPRFSSWAANLLALIGLLLLIVLYASAILDPSPACNRFDDSGC